MRVLPKLSHDPGMYYLLTSTKSKMFETDFRKRSHEIRSIKYGPDMQYLLNTVQ